MLDIDSSHLIQYACQKQCGILMFFFLLFFSVFFRFFSPSRDCENLVDLYCTWAIWKPIFSQLTQWLLHPRACRSLGRFDERVNY